MGLYPYRQRLTGVGIDRGVLARRWRIDGLDEREIHPAIARPSQQPIAHVVHGQTPALIGPADSEEAAGGHIGEGRGGRVRSRPQRAVRGDLHPARNGRGQHVEQVRRWLALHVARREHLHRRGADVLDRSAGDRVHAQPRIVLTQLHVLVDAATRGCGGGGAGAGDWTVESGLLQAARAYDGGGEEEQRNNNAGPGAAADLAGRLVTLRDL